MFVDGSKMRANASLKHHWSKDRCRQHLEKIDRRIEEILSEYERTDEQESSVGSMVEMHEELSDQQALRSSVVILVRVPKASSMVVRSCGMLTRNFVSAFSYNLNNLIRRRSTSFASRKRSCRLAI